MPDPVPATPAPGAPPAATSAGSSAMPFLTGGGGFAVGLLSMFGISNLLPTQHALALTVFGLVTCLILVMAIATTDMKTVTRKDGTVFAIGEWATGSLAVVMLVTGIVGATMFGREYWLHTVIAAQPAKATAYYSYNMPSSNGTADGPVLMVNGHPNSLWLMNHQPLSSVEVPADAMIEIRVPTVTQQQDVQRQIATNMQQDAPAAP